MQMAMVLECGPNWIDDILHNPLMASGKEDANNVEVLRSFRHDESDVRTRGPCISLPRYMAAVKLLADEKGHTV